MFTDATGTADEELKGRAMGGDIGPGAVAEDGGPLALKD